MLAANGFPTRGSSVDERTREVGPGTVVRDPEHEDRERLAASPEMKGFVTEKKKENLRRLTKDSIVPNYSLIVPCLDYPHERSGLRGSLSIL